MKKILIVEDNDLLLDLYTQALTPKGFSVLMAPTAQHGLTLLQTEMPDLVVLDIMLPGGGNGFDVLEQMRKNPKYAKIPVIVVTNLDSEEKTARDLGAVDYIVKSNIEFKEIIERITKHLV